MNYNQKALLKQCIGRALGYYDTPLQIFLTGPAGTGKTYTMKLIMETYNRFTQAHNVQTNSYIAAASTGKAAMSIGGTTVHSVFAISQSQRNDGLSFESLQAYRCAFTNVRVVLIDEVSMIGAGILHTIHERLRTILMEFEQPFGGMDMIFCGDWRQLPPVRQRPIYEPLHRGHHRAVLWQSLKYYPLVKVSLRTFKDVISQNQSENYATAIVAIAKLLTGYATSG